MSDRDRSDGGSLSDQNDCMETRPEDGCIVTLLVSKGGIDCQWDSKLVGGVTTTIAVGLWTSGPVCALQVYVKVLKVLIYQSLGGRSRYDSKLRLESAMDFVSTFAKREVDVRL